MFVERIRLARTSHKCWRCGRAIMHGQPYREVKVPPGDDVIRNTTWLLSREHLDVNCAVRHGGGMPAKPQIPGQGLFDVDAAVAPVIQPRPAGAVVRWSRYKANGTPCDDCKAAQAAGTLTSVAAVATWRRRAGDEELLLCYPHAEPRMRRDGR